jgi:hypothetical protein
LANLIALRLEGGSSVGSGRGAPITSAAALRTLERLVRLFDLGGEFGLASPALDAIEARAEDVLACVPSWLWDGERLPVPVEDIVDSCFGLLVRDVDDMAAAPGAPTLEPGQALSGLLLASCGEIWVNAAEAREWPSRRRFTIGHELGHWVLHRAGQTALFCRHGVVEPETTKPALPVSEDQANRFAAALLMPARLIRREYATGPDFDQLCRTFDASGAAMGRRLHAVIPRGGERR